MLIIEPATRLPSKSRGFDLRRPLEEVRDVYCPADVQIVEFPTTKVASIEHVGSPSREHDTLRTLIAWKIAQRLLDPVRFRSYGVHYTDPRTTPAAEHRVDFCLSIEDDVGPNEFGMVTKIIPANRCALLRDVGSRYDNKAARYLGETWFPLSGERIGTFPIFFHYVNVGPNVREEDMLTDVYLPLAPRADAAR